MISSAEAFKVVMDSTENFGTENVFLEDAVGRVLKEDILADRDFPPFDRICMDGIAINSVSYEKGQRIYPIQGMQAAGAKQIELASTEGCVEVATGGILPKGADSIIRFEDLDIKNNQAKITNEIKLRANIHYRGSDQKKGEIIIKRNKKISVAEIGVLATVGQSMIQVSKLPKIAIITTGNELVDIDKRPEAHQIRKSNVHVLSALLKQDQVVPSIFHIRDDQANMHEQLSDILATHDVLILSGAVSKGRYDFLTKVLEDLKVKKLLHFVAQRPGKPFWFGKQERKTIFAFPGNPVSTTVCFLKYCRPWIDKTVGLKREKPMVVLGNKVTFKPDLTYFAQASTHLDAQGRMIATVNHGNGSGDLAHLTQVDGFVELTKGPDEYHPGEMYPFIKMR